MSEIHPTAVVDPAAKIGEGTKIGPCAVIEGGAEIGADCEIQAHAVVTGQVEMGERNRIGYGAIIGAEPQDLSFKADVNSKLRIGNGNWIREHATLHRGSKENSETQIGNNNFLMAGAHVGHDCRVGNNVMIANNCLLGGHVEIGDGAFLGGGSVYHQFIRVGRNAITQGNSGFGKDLPPYMIGAKVNRIAGINSIGLRRAGFSVNDRAEIKMLYQLFFRSGSNLKNAMATADAESWGEPARQFLDFVRQAGKRGLCAGKRGSDPED